MASATARLCVFICLLGCSPLLRANELRAGAATQTLPESSPAQEPLEVNALVLADGDTTLAFCACDTRALDETLLHAVETRLAAAGSLILPGHLMLAATHTHTGGFIGIMPGALKQIAFGAFSQAHVNSAADTISRCVRTAELAMRPARLTIGATPAPEYTKNRSSDNLPCDTTLNALYVQGLDESPLAFLVNYAAHPTILFHTDTVYRRDFPGGLAARIRQQYGAGLPVLFINGAEGDVSPNPPPGETPLLRAQLMGQCLGEIALNAVKTASPITHPTLRVRSRTISMPPSELDNLAPQSAILQDCWIDRALFLSIPGELTSPIGLAVRAKARDCGAQYTFLCGLTNSYNGYFPDASEYFGAGYESKMNFYGAELTGWYLCNLFPETAMSQQACWQSEPLINAHFDLFQAAYACGQSHRAAIHAHWERTRGNLHAVIDTMKRLRVMPAAVKPYRRYLDRDGVKMVATCYFSYLARQQLVGLSDEQRVILMGIADGAQLPLDALLTEQYLRHPKNIPRFPRWLLRQVGVRGSDILGTYRHELIGFAP